MELTKTKLSTRRERGKTLASLAISLFAVSVGSALVWFAVVKLPALFLK